MIARGGVALDVRYRSETMSFEEEWILPKPIEHYRDDDVLGFVRKILPPSIGATLSGPTEDRVIRIVFATTDVPALSAQLTELGELDWDWEDDLEPPSDGDRYTVVIELVHDEVTKLRVSSNDDDNRAAWPLVFSIAASLSLDLDALIEGGPTLNVRKMN
jgi:hypothetical protein